MSQFTLKNCLTRRLSLLQRRCKNIMKKAKCRYTALEHDRRTDQERTKFFNMMESCPEKWHKVYRRLLKRHFRDALLRCLPNVYDRQVVIHTGRYWSEMTGELAEQLMLDWEFQEKVEVMIHNLAKSKFFARRKVVKKLNESLCHKLLVDRSLSILYSCGFKYMQDPDWSIASSLKIVLNAETTEFDFLRPSYSELIRTTRSTTTIFSKYSCTLRNLIRLRVLKPVFDGKEVGLIAIVASFLL